MVMLALGIIYAVGLQIVGLKLGILIGFISRLSEHYSVFWFCCWNYRRKYYLFISIWQHIA